MQTQSMERHRNTRLSWWKRPAWVRPGLLWFAFDMLAPTGLFYLTIDNGASVYLGLLASALLSAVSAIISFAKGKEVNGSRPTCWRWRWRASLSRW